MDRNAVFPSVGQTCLADLGPDTQLGHFTVEITFKTETHVSFLVTGGEFVQLHGTWTRVR